MNLVNAVIEALEEKNKRKPKAYDTTATVTRIEDGTAWVHIPGGVTETPVKLTINAKAGDTVQVRVSGGRSFLVGNATAPPTDDTVAQKAVGQVRTIGKVVEKVRQVAETAKQVATSAQQVADEGKAIAEATNQYFWHDGNGAHVTTVPQDTDPTGTTGLNSLWNSEGLLLRNNANILTQLGQSAVAFYDGNGNDVENINAAFGGGGSWIGRIGDSRLEMNNVGLTGFDGDGSDAFRLQFANSTGTAEIAERGETIANTSADMRYFPTTTIDIVNTPSDGTDMTYYLTIVVNTAHSGVKVAKLHIDREYDTSRIDSVTGNMSYLFYYDPAHYERVSFTYKWFYSTKSVVLSNIVTDPNCSIISLQVDTTLTVDASTTPSYTFGTRSHDPLDNGAYSFATGEGLIASSDDQAVVGKYNVEDANDVYAFIVGNGTDDSNRSNAFAIKWDGSVVAGGVTSYTPTWESGQNPANSHCIVSAGICSLSYQGQGIAHTAGTLLGTLPIGARPSSIVYVPFVKMAGGAVGIVEISTAGEIAVDQISSTTNKGRIYFNCSFPVV